MLRPPCPHLLTTGRAEIHSSEGIELPAPRGVQQGEEVAIRNRSPVGPGIGAKCSTTAKPVPSSLFTGSRLRPGRTSTRSRSPRASRSVRAVRRASGLKARGEVTVVLGVAVPGEDDGLGVPYRGEVPIAPGSPRSSGPELLRGCPEVGTPRQQPVQERRANAASPGVGAHRPGPNAARTDAVSVTVANSPFRLARCTP